MTYILTLKEKWDDVHIGPLETEVDIELACRNLMKRRLAEGFWYEGEAADHAELILSGTPGLRTWTARRFLESRSMYEYEQVIIEKLTPP